MAFLNELTESIDIELKFTNRLHAQFQAIGLSPYTINFSRIAHTRYKASTNGERTFFYCLTDPPVSHSNDPSLQFGWEDESIWRNIGLHQFEYGHLLLGAAISESLPESYAGAVLDYLAQEYETSERVKPSRAQWIHFATATKGLLTPSEFALIMDDRMRLDPYRVTSGHSTSCTNSLIPPETFAKAFDALGKLSLAGTGELTLAGGNFLGWFAAMAELFLDLNVEISSRDGQVLYTAKRDSKAFLKLVFTDNVESIKTSVQDLTESIAALTVVCEPDQEENMITRGPLAGRVGWDSFFPQNFENAFHLLAHQESKIFVQSIGGAARLFELLASDPNTPSSMISEWNRHNQAALGSGLIQTICNWFPELRHLQGRLDRIQRLKTQEEISEKCNIGAQGLIRMCGCTICYVGHYVPETKDSGTLPQSFCLLALMETILNLALAMSRITVARHVYPSRAGVLCIYQRQVSKLLEVKRMRPDEAQGDFGRVYTLFSRDWNANYSTRLQIAVAMFSGSWPAVDIHDNLMAIAHEGICAHVMDIQYGDKRAPRQDSEFIRINPGHISWKQKAYSRLSRGRPQDLPQSDYTWERAHCEHLSEDLYLK